MLPSRSISSGLAGLALAYALAGCHHPETARAPEAPSPGPLPASRPPTAREQALLDQLPPAYRHPDLENGELHLNLCRSCHTFVQGAPDLLQVEGERLCRPQQDRHLDVGDVQAFRDDLARGQDIEPARRPRATGIGCCWPWRTCASGTAAGARTQGRCSAKSSWG